jgi:hypothetical protein
VITCFDVVFDPTSATFCIHLYYRLAGIRVDRCGCGAYKIKDIWGFFVLGDVLDGVDELIDQKMDINCDCKQVTPK